MSIARVLTVLAGLAAAGAAGAGVALWQINTMGTADEMQSEGFSGDEIASIEGIVGAYVQSNPERLKGAEPAQDVTAEMDTARIENVVRNYLLDNPEIMRDVFAALEAKEEQEQKDQLSSFIAENADKLYGGTDGLVLGNPEGDVTLVEFFDYNCGYCRRALDDMTALLDSDSNLKIVMKEFPILSPGSIEAAKVSLAVAKQGRYREFHTNLMSAPGQANGAKALQVAEELGIDMNQVKMDMNTAEVKAEIDQTQAMASTIGIRGTPAYVIGNELIPGAIGLENLRAKIQEVRDNAS